MKVFDFINLILTIYKYLIIKFLIAIAIFQIKIINKVVKSGKKWEIFSKFDIVKPPI